MLGPDAKTASPSALKERLLALRQDAGFWAVILNRGGHFAAAIFSFSAAESKGTTAGNHAPPPFSIIAHKTFHRYVVRYEPSTMYIFFLHSLALYTKLASPQGAFKEEELKGRASKGRVQKLISDIWMKNAFARCSPANYHCRR